MIEMLEKMLAVSKKLGPPPKRYAIVASRVRGNQKLSDFERFQQLPVGEIGLGGAMPVIPSDIKITKTVERTKVWKRLNRPSKTKTKKVQVPAIIMMDMSIFDIPEFPQLVFTQEAKRRPHEVRY